MARILPNNIKTCEPGEVEGPYVGSCVYEYVIFIDCSATQMQQDYNYAMGAEAHGDILTYLQGGPPNLTHKVHYNPYQIEGTPYSKITSLGLVGTDWMDFFLDVPPWNGSQWVNAPNWKNAQNHNYMPFKHRYKLIKWIYQKDHNLSKEDVEAGWQCPYWPAENPTFPEITRQKLIDIGIECPPYYALNSCVDCGGWSDPKQKTIYFEAIDNQPLPGDYVEYPNKTRKCHKMTQIPGPRNNQNINTLKLIPMSQAKKDNARFGYTEHIDCTTCRENYWIAVSKVELQDKFPNANPEFINSASVMGGVIAPEVAKGNVGYYAMRKDPTNDAFYNTWGIGGFPFFYIINKTCYKACFYDPNLGAVGMPPCPPAQLNFWTQYHGQAIGPAIFRPGVHKWIHSISFPKPIIPNVCDCEKDAGGTTPTNEPIGRGSSYGQCHPPDVPPDVDQAKPKDQHISVSTRVPFKNGVTFKVIADCGGCPTLKYQWFYNGNAVAGETGSTYTRNNVRLTNNLDKVHCEVSTSGGTKKSRTATVFVTHDVDKCYDDDQKLFVCDAWQYCCLLPEIKNMIYRSILTKKVKFPDGIIFNPKKRKMYFDPSEFPVTGPGALNPQDCDNHYWIQLGATKSCTIGAFTIIKSTNTYIKKWKDIDPSLKNIDQNGDENCPGSGTRGKHNLRRYGGDLEYNDLLDLSEDFGFMSKARWKSLKDEIRQLFGYNWDGTLF